MPVKVRCPDCSKVVAAPDRARGKSIRCPECEARIRVPAGSGGAKRKTKKAARPKRKRTSDDEDFLAGLDMDRVEDTSVDVCSKCGAELYEDDSECPECGWDESVGGLGKVAQKKRRKGPDPAEFYAKAWTDSARFVWNNKMAVVKTGLYWSLYGILSWCTLFVSVWSTKIPPKLFWFGLFCLFSLGMPGWFWSLNGRIIRATLARKDDMGRIENDFYGTLSLGLKSVIWPYVMMLPFTGIFIVGAAVVFAVWCDFYVYFDATSRVLKKMKSPLVAEVPDFIIGSALVFAPLAFIGPIVKLVSGLFFPVAQIHMAGRITYKAWLVVDLTVIFFKNILAALYWLVMWVIVHLPVIIFVALMWIFWLADFWLFILETLGTLVEWSSAMVGNAVEVEIVKGGFLSSGVRVKEEASAGFIFYTMLTLGWAVLIFVMVVPTAFIMAIPTVFMMRVNGLLAYYNQKSLDLPSAQKAGEPAGFWPRWLAAWVDLLIVFLAALLTRGIVLTGLWFLAFLGAFSDLEILDNAWNGGLGLWGLLFSAFTAFYYVWGESGYAQVTLGKHALGLKVTDMDGNRISRSAGFARYASRALSYLTMGIGFIMAGLTEKKQALHDITSKTLVVWKGDDGSS